MADDLPITTIPPFADQAALPACAAACVPLYDANGGCVPPAIPEADATVYTSCFCANPSVAGFSTAATGVCDTACPDDDAGLTSIQSWFQSICSANGGSPDGDDDNDNNQSSNPGQSTSSIGGGSSGGSGGSSNNENNGDWLSNHWQWVIMIVVLVVGIAAIWIGAAIWRRRYLKKKDRQSSMNQKSSGSANRPSWGPGMTSGPNVGVMSGSGAPGSFMPGSGEPKEKKKWTVRGRT